ncbi:hypothetical protein [Peterkaempfera sp. SMS 1(5)a]|uniref:hypothetical protein n=1 Tax=Peterkaempfera podocarpi TaxID=3232308 RepID=UPI003670C863
MVPIAHRLLFGIYSGIVPEGIADLVIEDIDWAGDSTVLLSSIERRTAFYGTRPYARLRAEFE